MIKTDRGSFRSLMESVYEFWNRELSAGSLELWWSAMNQFELSAISESLSRHMMNPDSGQFIPKPADVVKMLGGGTADQALSAWTKLENAVRLVGPYRDVIFDDAMIHACVDEMGGWIKLCSQTEKEWPFQRNEFVTRYRSYAMRGVVPTYQPVLIGIFRAFNEQNHYHTDSPTLCGDVNKCLAVQRGASPSQALRITRGVQTVQQLIGGIDHAAT